MKYVVNFANFWYDFIVGDDWTVAAGVVVALVVAAILTGLKLAVWWWIPLAVVLLLGASVMRVARTSRPR